MPNSKKAFKLADSKIGELTFFAGLLLAIIAGFFEFEPTIVTQVLVVLGVLTGLINITSKETTGFLIAAIALLVAGTAGMNNLLWVGSILTMSWIGPIMINIINFVAPAAIIVALKAVYELARKK